MLFNNNCYVSEEFYNLYLLLIIVILSITSD